MRIIKLAIISVFFLGLVIFLLSLLIPSQMRVSRAVTIEMPVDTVKASLLNTGQWQDWNVMLQQSLTGVTTSADGLVSDQLNVAIVRVDSSVIQMQWQQQGGQVITSAFSLTSVEGDRTIVQWYFDFYVEWYPWEKFGSIIFDKQMGPSMERSLDLLKKHVEHNE